MIGYNTTGIIKLVNSKLCICEIFRRELRNHLSKRAFEPSTLTFQFVYCLVLVDHCWIQFIQSFLQSVVLFDGTLVDLVQGFLQLVDFIL